MAIEMMTQAGLDKLKQELADALAQRPVISAAIAEARAPKPVEKLPAEEAESRDAEENTAEAVEEIRSEEPKAEAAKEAAAEEKAEVEANEHISL